MMRDGSDMALEPGDILYALFSRLSPRHPWIVEQTLEQLWVLKARKKELAKEGVFTCIARCHILEEIQDDERTENV